MAETEVTVEHNEGSEVEHSTERGLGHVEAEVEHHEEQLEVHADSIENLSRDKEWIQAEIQRLDNMIAGIPVGVTREEVETLITGLKDELKQVQETASTSSSPVTLPPETEPSSKSPKPPSEHFRRLSGWL